MRSIAVIAVAGWAATSGAAVASTDKYHVTAEEKAACEGDASQLCSGAGSDEDALLSCMRANQSQLSSGCRVVFQAGLKRRGLRE